ncbi:MAG: PASTA domain-containing protein, partial [Bacteroidota bacterium]
VDFESAKEVSSAVLSDIKLDIVPSAITATTTTGTMPNILGLTETAVRKVLTNYGLRLDAVYHSTKDTNLVAGQSFKQSPGPNDPVEEGQEVIVIFAKPIN